MAIPTSPSRIPRPALKLIYFETLGAFNITSLVMCVSAIEDYLSILLHYALRINNYKCVRYVGKL